MKTIQKLCKWYCRSCMKCHTNACPDFSGGIFEVPCEGMH